MELKREYIYILYLIDMATRLTKASIIRSKKREIIIDQVFMKWLAEGPGAPNKLLTDNGTEFANQEFQNMCEMLNITDCKTAIESP